jgi:hypothetical protein
MRSKAVHRFLDQRTVLQPHLRHLDEQDARHPRVLPHKLQESLQPGADQRQRTLMALPHDRGEDVLLHALHGLAEHLREQLLGAFEGLVEIALGQVRLGAQLAHLGVVEPVRTEQLQPGIDKLAVTPGPALLGADAPEAPPLLDFRRLFAHSRHLD